jgi:glycosyltransferase involved in cell wall biosynthesis
MNDDIEVILSDDHSTEDYQVFVEKFSDRLCIKQIQTDYNFAPGNTREKGCTIATGEWLTFADQDDFFEPGSLKIIKQQIEEYEEPYHVVSNFREVKDYTYETIQEMRQTRNWCHGKFYNMDNFWRAYDIHFKKDLKTHEDIYISSVVMCILNTLNGDQPLYSETFTYNWVANVNSISRTTYNDTNFVENFFEDYLTSTIGVCEDMYKGGYISRKYAIEKCFDVILYTYFYIQRFKFHRPKDYVKENITYVSEYYKRLKKLLMFSNMDLYTEVAKHDTAWYVAVRASARKGVGPCIEQESLMQYLNSLDPDDRGCIVDWTKM